MTNIPKFRAWLIKEEKMCEVLQITFYEPQIFVNRGFRDDEFYNHDEVILMQSTGLTDKNGKLIFCDDIVKIEQDGIERIHKVYWGGDYPAFEFSPDLGCECNGFSYAIA